MPQIEIPFTPGQRVRNKGGREFVIEGVLLDSGEWHVSGRSTGWWKACYLTLVEPVIEWERRDEWSDWRSDDWYAKDDGRLMYGRIGPHSVGTFDDPRAIAEATQKMWNEARKHD